MKNSPNLIEFSSKGLYCPAGKFYIDPFRSVDRALITHAHGDHLRAGMKHYLAHHDSVPIMKLRLGENINVQGVAYGEELNVNGVKVSYHPAGHILGSSQIRLEYKGEVWVVSGDYKIEDDGLTVPFEPVKCHAFITESTFGLPIYKWAPQAEVFADMNNWWRENKEKGVTSVVLAYALGKAQRILHHLDPAVGDIFVHSTIRDTNEAFINAGIPVVNYPVIESGKSKSLYKGSLIIAPPGWASSNWLNKFQPYSTAIASGWLAVRGSKRRFASDRGFVLSDHADWLGLNLAVKECGAERVFVTHGFTKVFSKWLQTQGIDAHVVNTLYENQFSGDEEEGIAEGEEAE